MGYAVCFSPCMGCGIVFGYNPVKVPSFRVKGVREPICKSCIDRANIEREKNGLELLTILPDAYEPIREEELPQ